MFEQYLYTDNRQGRGLSVLNKSSGLPTELLGMINRYIKYNAPAGASRETTPELLADAHRYNCDFARAPMLMNTAYIGQDVTTKRNRNFAAHTLVSTGPLKEYAVDYFSNEGLFTREFAREDVDGTKQHTTPLSTIIDTGLAKRSSIDEVVSAINKNIELMINFLIQPPLQIV